eukprot:359171-Chlamydomonas_euryale.AAC.4
MPPSFHTTPWPGGFVAPFQPEMADKKWDFRAPNVLSISASGHKFGESVCGTGWVSVGVWESVAGSVRSISGPIPLGLDARIEWCGLPDRVGSVPLGAHQTRCGPPTPHDRRSIRAPKRSHTDRNYPLTPSPWGRVDIKLDRLG